MPLIPYPLSLPLLRCIIPQQGGDIMGKGDNREKKDTKKAPKKTLMEKRKEKREKKAQHNS
jgi:hypothetical protein